ncbi:hypothetical protein MNBD_GAMMA17-1634 [hydrothermal vent metagenome]|uniref:Beta-ketoacyl synthase N-terminal domain-containing protein n=1 Tax=hydrothermal vent metagenome TaxID=652676 RepID=A0A3B0ZVV5_9ZZZZ
MYKKIGIYATSNYHHNITNNLPSLKEQVKEACGQNIRRIDRLTQLALIGACQCNKQVAIPPQTSLYLVSMYGAFNNSLTIFKQMYQETLPPGPLKFVNTVGNAACFHISKQLALDSSSLFISRSHFLLEACIKLAHLDLSARQTTTALIGLVTEARHSIDIHRQGLNTEEATPKEVSQWMLLSYDMPGLEPMAKIIHVKEPMRFSELLAWIKMQFEQQNAYQVHLMISSNATSKKHSEVASQLGTAIKQTITSIQDSCHTLDIFNFIEQKATGPTLLIYIDTDNRDRWSAISIEK